MPNLLIKGREEEQNLDFEKVLLVLKTFSEQQNNHFRTFSMGVDSVPIL